MVNRLVSVNDDLELPQEVREKFAESTELSATIGDRVGYQPGFDIVLLWGQSNMSGRGTPYSTRTDPANPAIKQWRTSGTLGIQEAREPLNMHDIPSGIGPGLQFARWYAARRLVPGRKVLLVPCAHGGTQLSTTETPLGWRRGVAGNLYANGIAQAQAALAAANAIPGTVNRIVVVLWLQGETDGTNLVPGETYRADLDADITGSRTDLGIADLPWVIGTMVPEYLSVGTRAAINAVHRDTPNRLDKVDVAVSAANMNKGDGNHFDGPGNRFNGKAMFDAFERIVEGLAPYQEPIGVVLGPVAGLNVVATSAQVLTASWNALDGASSYRVEYQEPGSSTWIQVGTTVGTTLPVGALVGSTTYNVRVVPIAGGLDGIPSAAVARTTAAEVTDASDSFNRANGSIGSPDVGPAWTVVNGTFLVTDNLAQHGSASNSQTVLEASRADAIVRIKMALLDHTTTSTRNCRIIWRSDGTTSNFWTVQYRSNQNVYQLYKYVGGAATGGLDLPFNPSDGDVVTISTTGDLHAIRINGTLVHRFVDAHSNTATKHGFGGSGTNIARYDDFKIAH